MPDDVCPACNGTGKRQPSHLDGLGTEVATMWKRTTVSRAGYTGNPCTNCGG